jgi:predicted double-glycine peptidase
MMQVTSRTRLKVPLSRQKEGSADCGPICVSMILDYYSIKNNMDQIPKEIRAIDKKMVLPKDSFTYTPQLGLYLLNKGFEVEIITFNPWLFRYRDKLKINPIEDVEEFYERIKRKRISVEIKRPSKFFIDFMKKGGKVVVRVPDEKDIRTEIEHGRPLIALLTTNFLYPKATKRTFNFHANVITGIDAKYVYVNDPLANINGGRRKHLIPEFMYGLYASAYGAPDNASLIKIRR